MKAQLIRPHFLLFFFSFLSLIGCQVSAEAPPPTLQAIAVDTETAAEEISILQEQSHRSGQLILYAWEDVNANQCIGTTYLTSINSEWQVHDSLTARCLPASSFNAAYTGNSIVEAPFGPPRHTVIYGVSQEGEMVRVVWSDGQVMQVPLVNGSFLQVRDDAWHVEQVELIGADNQVLLIEDWTTN